MTVAIKCDNVAKQYRLGLGRETLRERIAAIGRQLLGRDGRAGETDKTHLWALRDVSFEVGRGEALGIIGPNGAGKTTILRMLANITKPTTGTVSVHGRLSALIALGAGFHPDLTGRENIYLNGSILGLSRREIDARFDEIVDFSELERFIDTPVKRYSSGMYARLGFSVAAHVEPDILLVDEVLSVGDTSFQMKCHKRMDELKQRGTTLVFVSHNLNAVQQVCSRVIVMYRGETAFDGPAAEAVAEYSNILRSNASGEKPASPESGGLAERRMTHAARITHVEMVGEDGRPKRVVQSGEAVRVRVDIEFYEDAISPVFACAIRSETGQMIYDTTTKLQDFSTSCYSAGDLITVEYYLTIHLLNGIYQLATDLAYTDLSCYYDYVAHALSFVVVNGSKAQGIANLHAKINFYDDKSTSNPLKRDSIIVNTC